MTRKLVLKREALQELTSDEMRDVVAGTRPTWFSCLTYISCNPLDCVSERTKLCVEG